MKIMMNSPSKRAHFYCRTVVSSAWPKFAWKVWKWKKPDRKTRRNSNRFRVFTSVKVQVGWKKKAHFFSRRLASSFLFFFFCHVLRVSIFATTISQRKTAPSSTSPVVRRAASFRTRRIVFARTRKNIYLPCGCQRWRPEARTKLIHLKERAFLPLRRFSPPPPPRLYKRATTLRNYTYPYTSSDPRNPQIYLPVGPGLDDDDDGGGRAVTTPERSSTRFQRSVVESARRRRSSLEAHYSSVRTLLTYLPSNILRLFLAPYGPLSCSTPSSFIFQLGLLYFSFISRELAPSPVLFALSLI